MNSAQRVISRGALGALHARPAMRALALAGGMAVALTSLLGATSAHAEESSGSAISAEEKLSHESHLSDFLRISPEPAPLAEGATADQQNAYAQELAAWWEAVPWDAVAGQWGCESTVQAVSFNPANAEGVTTASHGGVMDCAADFSEAQLAVVAIPQVRSVTESRAALARYCDFTGGDDFCLEVSGSTLTASFQYQQSGVITGQARAGQPGLGQPCGLGTQIAIGPLGMGQLGSVWYASGTVNQNSYWSSSFLLGGGAVYGTWCANI